MKVFIIDYYYTPFLESLHQVDDAIKNYPYKEWKNYILSKKFGTADFYSINLQTLGVEAEEFIINDEVGQKKWAKEHNIRIAPSRFQNIPKLKTLFRTNWKGKILKEQIFSYRPDIIFTLYVKNTDSEILHYAKKKLGCYIVGQIACPLPPRHYFDEYDLLVSSLPHYVELFRSWGKNAEYLPLAFEHTLLPLLTKLQKSYDVTHIGGYGPIHNERNKILEEIAKKIKIDFWGYATENLDKDSPILRNFQGQAWGLDMYNILYNCKITLTKHITQVASIYANNMTLYEATGCGTLLMTDWKDNLPKLFEPGKEIETYKTTDELVEKIQYYLSHEHERSKIACAGRQKTLSLHTYSKRTKKLINFFQSL